jgi:hypothetical protein
MKPQVPDGPPVFVPTHERHRPVQLELQHTASCTGHRLLWHWFALVQACPLMSPQTSQSHELPQVTLGRLVLPLHTAAQLLLAQMRSAPWQAVPGPQVRSQVPVPQLMVAFWQSVEHATLHAYRLGQLMIVSLQPSLAPHSTVQAKPAGQLSVAPSQASGVLQAMMQVPLLQPPLQTAGQIPPGGVGS